MKKRIKTAAACSLLALLIFTAAGCRTAVSFEAVQPAEIDMSDYRTLGVLDFAEYELSRFSSGGYILFEFLLNSGYRPSFEDRFISSEIARYTTRNVVRTLERTDYFQVIPPAQLRNYLTGIASVRYDGERLRKTFGIDALIIGSIEDIHRREYVRERSRWVSTDEEDEQVLVRTKYLVQEAYLEISYSVVSVRDGRILATKRLDGRRSTETEIPDGDVESFRAPSMLPMYRRIIDDFMPEVRDQLAPRTVREVRRLLRDPLDDPRMEEADDMAKDGLHRRAADSFLNIWYDTRNYAAGYNAAILFEVIGELDRAASLMREVAEQTGESRAYREANRLIQAREDYYRALEQLRE